MLPRLAFLLIAQPSFRSSRPEGARRHLDGYHAAIGYKTLDGTLNKWIATSLWLANGAQFWLAPQSAIDLCEMKGTNLLGKAMFTLVGGQMLCVGTYLAALLMEKSQSELSTPTPWPSMVWPRPSSLSWTRTTSEPPKAGPRLDRSFGRPRLQGA